MQAECEKHGIKFVRIKPRRTWEEFFYNKCITKKGTETIYGFPTRKARWCNDKYKLDSLKQLEEWMNSLGCYTVRYIGYCADEEKRFAKREREKFTPLLTLTSRKTLYCNGQKISPYLTTFIKQTNVVDVCFVRCQVI